MLAGGIDIYAHTVHHTLHSLLQTLAEARLIDIMLVLSHANRLGVNLH